VRFSFLSGVRNDLLQEISDDTGKPYMKIDGLGLTSHNLSVLSGSSSANQFSYTVPANKMAIISGISLHVEQQTLPTTIQTNGILAKLTRSGGTLRVIAGAHIRPVFIGQSVSINVNGAYYLEPGDKYQVDLNVGSITGICLVEHTTALVEYDE